MEKTDKEVLRIIDDDEQEVKPKQTKYANFLTFLKHYINNNGDFITTCKQLNVEPQQVAKEIFKDDKKRKLFAEAKKVVLILQTEQLEQQLFKTARVKEQLGMFFLKTAFPEIYGEKGKRPLTIKFHSKLRGKIQTIDIPDLQEE